jgi:hypothetical protein
MTAMPLPVAADLDHRQHRGIPHRHLARGDAAPLNAPSPCHQACPISGEIADWIGHARHGRWQQAWEVLTRHNPFPAVIGRVCHHPCESACNRAALDAPVSICALERAVGEAALAAGWAFAPPTLERNGRVAVVGAGPAGLSAAFQLRRAAGRSPWSTACASPAVCCAVASRPTVCRAPCSTPRSRACSRSASRCAWASRCRGQTTGRPCARRTTQSSSPPGPRCRAACPRWPTTIRG